MIFLGEKSIIVQECIITLSGLQFFKTVSDDLGALARKNVW